jgi:co-chaperonin GroES (HSP10)
MTESINTGKVFPQGGRPIGAEIIVELYVRKGISINEGSEISEESKLILSTGEISSIVRPDSMVKDDHLSTKVGRVLSVGERAFQGVHWKGFKPGCEVGDWVIFDPVGGIDYQYLGMNVRVFHDSNVRVVIPDPSYVTKN